MLVVEVVDTASFHCCCNNIEDLEKTKTMTEDGDFSFMFVPGKYDPPGEYTRTKWNYLVLGKGLTTSAAKAAFIAKIRAFDFVETSSSICKYEASFDNSVLYTTSIIHPYLSHPEPTFLVPDQRFSFPDH